VSNELARELISAGVHFGHGSSRWNPKMAPYIFGTRSKIHIIDVKETLKGLLIAKKLLTTVVSSGKDVVFVGTKRQAQRSIENASAQCGMHFVSQRWLGGMLTNFRTVRSRLQRLEHLEGLEAGGKLAEESKKQESRMKREMRKISTNLGGVRKMNRLPGAVIVVDTRRENLALQEARKLGIVTIGIIDTDSDPDAVDVAIPANDDSIKAIELLLAQLAEAVSIGKTMFKPQQAVKPVRPRSKRQSLASASEKPVSATVVPAKAAAEPAAPAVAVEAKAAEPKQAEKPARSRAKRKPPASATEKPAETAAETKATEPKQAPVQ
jgi:small subunit ribosomal protein S2